MKDIRKQIADAEKHFEKITATVATDLQYFKKGDRVTGWLSPGDRGMLNIGEILYPLFGIPRKYLSDIQPL